MLVTVIAWIYITFLSYSWGSLLLRLTSGVKLLKEKPYIHSSVICFTGLILIASIASILSFFLPLGSGSIQFVFFLPSLFFIKHTFAPKNKSEVRWLPVNLILLTCCLVMVLIMCSYTISHPDSLGYHIQIIKWIEEYKIVPGITNINPRLGFQSNWFILCALFNFNFIVSSSYVYLNSLITLWILFFIISQINQSIVQKHQKESWLWIAFLLLTLGSYTQIMLTATSASPDYIAAIYIWLALYFLYNSSGAPQTQLLLLAGIFSFFAVSIKLSTLPISIIGVYAIIKLITIKKTKTFLLSASITGIIITSFLARNAVTSGYLLYPATFPNILTVDWKIPEKKVQREKDYVTAFAKTESGASNQDIIFANNMKLNEWLPIWWHNRAIVDKIILILLGLSIILLIVFAKKLRKQRIQTVICLLASIVGTIFWFLLGPDPRFGFGFIIGAIGLTANILIPQNLFSFINRRLIFLMLFLLNATLLTYIAHRCNKYFSRKQLIHTLGVNSQPESTINCDGITFQTGLPFIGCAANPIPCIEDSCKNFRLRGGTISDGFRPKISP